MKNWKNWWKAAGIRAGLLSLLTSIVGLPELKESGGNV